MDSQETANRVAEPASGHGETMVSNIGHRSLTETRSTFINNKFMIEIIFLYFFFVLLFYVYRAISSSNKLINKLDLASRIKDCEDFFGRIIRILPANIMLLVASLEANESQ